MKAEKLGALHQAVRYIKEPEMLKLVHQVIGKVERMSVADFISEEFDLKGE